MTFPTRRLLPWTLALALTDRGALAQSAVGYRVETFTTEHGLPSQAISDVVQTSDGYLWIVAGGILSRFDGHEFRNFTQANTPLLERRVLRLHAGLGDTLWILDEGNAVFAYAGGKFLRVVAPSMRSLISVAQHGDGTLLGLGVSTAWRLGRGHGRDVEVLPRLQLTYLRSAKVLRDGRGKVWVVDSPGVLRELAGSDTSGRQTLDGRATFSRSTGEVLTLRSRGGFREVLRPNGDVTARYPGSGNEGEAFVDRTGRLWVLAARTYDVYERGQTLPVAKIAQQNPGTTGAMMEDESGCAWLAELSLLKVCRVPFHNVTVTHTAREFIVRGIDSSVLSWDSSGNVVSLLPTGFSRTIAPGRPDLRFARVFVDRSGTPWWSPNSVYTRATRGERGGTMRLLPHRDAYRFAADPHDDAVVWYAVGDHLYRAVLPAAGNARLVDSVAAEGMVSAMVVGMDGALWAITKRADFRSQLLRVADGRVATFSTHAGFPTAPLRAVLADEDGSVWLGTYGGGLVRLKNGRFQAVQESDGLGDNVVTSLLDDGDGNLWMGGNRSVHRIARRELSAFLDGSVHSVSGVTYGRADGLSIPETTGNPGTRDDMGRLWFPTLAGASVVDAALAVSLGTTPPRIHIQSIRSDRDTVEAPTGTVRLTRGARRLVLAYTGISLRNSAAVRYEYRIDDLDRNWIKAGAGREANYNTVSPGTHTFRVRAFSASGIPSTSDATIQVIVPPFFTETPAFYVLMLALTGGAALAMVRYRERHLRRRDALMTRAVEERTAKLAAALETVQRQTDELRTLDEAKSRFFANVSHEFRTPLSLIIGPIDDLRDGRSGELNTTVRRRLDTVQTSARRLLQLVEQLLDVARLESGTLQLNADERDLIPQVRRLAESFASLAARKGIDFRLSCPVGGLRVRHDPDQMEKVISNLMGNALKFTPAGGHVELRVTTDTTDGMAILEVRDSGAGIAPENHARVFERFFQVDDSSRRAHEGTGIGLALVRELVELHGGTVSLTSALGQGSVFTVRLPLAAGASALSARNSGEHTIAVGEIRPEASRHLPDNGTAPDIATSNDMTVLVVEDNAELLEFLRDHLAERFRVLVAENGVRGLAMARAFVPDLIISDVMMPEMDGQSLCTAVKSDAEIDFIPVILLTAKASRDSRLAGLQGGADDYLTKPVDLKELLIRADNLIASRRRVRERWQTAEQPLPSITLPVKAPPGTASERALLDGLSSVLAAHLSDEEFNVESMSVAMGMGRSTLYRRLEPLLGKSPMDALWEYRLAQAAQWLVETSITVSEVAYGVGFKSVPHFCGRFRERYGETPSGYRRARQGSQTSNPAVEPRR